MKRWRCVDCGAVHTCRPSTYWRRFLAPISIILTSLTAKLAGLRWQRPESRQRQQYWHSGYLIQSRYDGLPSTAVLILLAAFVIVATHSTADRTTSPVLEPPHRRLASTGPP